MFKEFRNDETQKLFTEALNGMMVSPYGFKSQGLLVLTTCPAFNKALLKAMLDKGVANLKFGGLKLDAKQKLDTCYSNAIYFKQETCLSGWEYGPSNVGGEKIIILADSPEKLKMFTKIIVDKHAQDFNIGLNRPSVIVDPIVPMLQAKLVLNNKPVTSLINDGLYCSKMLLEVAVSDINDTISKTQKEEATEKNL